MYMLRLTGTAQAGLRLGKGVAVRTQEIVLVPGMSEELHVTAHQCDGGNKQEPCYKMFTTILLM